MRITIDAGHGPETPGKRTPDGSLREFHFNRTVAQYVREELQQYDGVEILFTHADDRDVPLQERTNKANAWKADVFVSIHANAFGDGWNDANGIETFVFTSRPAEALRLAEAVQRELVKVTGRRNRGVKAENLHVLRETKMTAILVECGFMTNREEAGLLKSDEYRRKCAKAIVQGIVEMYGLQKTNAGTPIAGAAQATVQQAQEWARQRKADQSFIDVAPIYWRFGTEIGIRPEVAYAQAAKETAFGRFGGVVDRSFHNWCGLKTTKGGSNSDPNAHARFPDDETGVLAHLQHLALYAGVEVTGKIVDPRHFSSIEGTARTVEALGGKWAPAADYGQSIVRNYLAGLLSTKVSTPPVDNPVEKPHWAQKDHDELRAAGYLLDDHTGTLDEPASKGIVFALVNRLRKEMEQHQPDNPQPPEEPPEPEPQPPANPEPTPEPVPGQPQNYPPCFLGLPGPCVRDDGTIDWKGQEPPERELPPFDEIVERAKESVVLILALGFGTGWLIDNQHIITAKHVIGKMEEFTVRFRDKQETKAVPVAIHPEADLAIIRLKSPTTRPALRIANVDKVTVGTEIAVIGHEDRRDWVEKYGRVEREQIPGQPWEFDVDATIKHGNSGGPVLDRQGNVLGVAVQNTGDCVNLLWFREWIERNTK